MHQLHPSLDQALLVDILVEAFAEDPVVNWICDRPGFREFAYRSSLPIYLQHQRCFVDESRSGVTLWLPPKIFPNAPVTLATVWESLSRFGIKATYRGWQVVTKMEKFHPHHPHYYLYAIGTRKAARGTGLGSALMKQITQQADQQNLPVYLENSNINNMGFYQAHGFEVLGEIKMSADGPTLWPMQRKPHSS